MKRLLFVAALAAATAPALAANVGVSINIGHPGFYGRLNMGDYPPPQLIYQQPRFIERAAPNRPPIYLRVRPGHEKNWRRYCRVYNACGERVYFVRDDWYSREYVPRYQKRHNDRYDSRRDGRGYDHRDDRGYNRHDGNRGYGPNR